MSETKCASKCGNLSVEGSQFCKVCGMPYYRVETIEDDPRVYGATHDIDEDETTDKKEFVDMVNSAIESANEENNEPDERKGQFRVYISSDGGEDKKKEWQFEVDLEKYINTSDSHDGVEWSWNASVDTTLESEILKEYHKQQNWERIKNLDKRVKELEEKLEEKK